MKDKPIDRVRSFIEANRLLQKGDRVVVAFSGGKDSTVLLHILDSLKEELDIAVSAAHLNHGIRGEEAERDERFVTELCDQWDIPLYAEKADVPAIAAQTGESAELVGRKLRYRFLEEVARDGAKIATAHHRDDNAETVLWNLCRGAGPGGLSGIPVRRDNIIRPLLCLSRAEIEAYCREHELRYVTDSTNLSEDYTRNKLRHTVMPVLRELNPGVEENIARTSALMREADAYLNNISLKELNNAKTTYGYSCERLLTLEPVILQYAVKNFLKNAGAPVDFRHIELIIDSMHDGGAVDLGRDFTATCAQGTLRMCSQTTADAGFGIPFSEYIERHGTRVFVRGGTLYDADGAKINNLLLHHCIPCDIINCNTVLRHRRAGDVFTDPRRGVTKTLKKLLNELKIPREKRDEIFVVAEDHTVLWLQGVGVSGQAASGLSRDGELILMSNEQVL